MAAFVLSAGWHLSGWWRHLRGLLNGLTRIAYTGSLKTVTLLPKSSNALGERNRSGNHLGSVHRPSKEKPRYLSVAGLWQIEEQEAIYGFGQV